MASDSQELKIKGYLPNDAPPIGEMILLGFQHVLTMFPATVLVALLVGFHVSTVLLASGLATIVALLLSRWRIGKFIPLYYGSSFSYIAATVAVTGAQFAQPVSDELIGTAQAGILVTGLVNVLIGVLIRLTGGRKAIDVILPPIVTGSVAATIGFALGFAALDMAAANWGIALLTLLATVAFSVYLQGRGFIGMLPVLLGAVFGYLISIPFGLVDFSSVASAAVVQAPHLTLPNFSSNLTATAIFGIAVMAIATIPESTAHLYQIGLYVDHLADKLEKDRYDLSQYIGFNLILDGIGDMVNGLIGGVAGTNYGENNSLMAITRNYSGPALIAAGVIAIVMSFSGTLSAFVNSIPLAVTGGLAIYLFGVIGMQGVALMMAEKVNLFDPKQLAIGATILVVGVGGHIGYSGGFLPIPLLPGIFPQGWPAIATGAVLGILLNLIFIAFKPPAVESLED
ncbi:MAG: xanthine permease [Anaerolineae bacterium]|nr:xanthine permease [Anaerolineae bacterium]